MRHFIFFVFLTGLLVASCQSGKKEKTTASNGLENARDSLKEKLDSAGENTGDDIDGFMNEYKNIDSVDWAYYEYRMETASPSFGLKKIEDLIENARYNDEDETETISDGAYDSLSFREKFTYHMIHPESYSQICDPAFPPKESQKKIFANLLGGYEEYKWSDRQKEFLRNNRDSVMALIRQSARKSNRVELNYKLAIEEINGKEMIPFLIEVYKANPKDGDILTLLILLMKENNYKSFVSSSIYQKLYGDDSLFEAFIDNNTANQDMIIKQAADFYNVSHK